MKSVKLIVAGIKMSDVGDVSDTTMHDIDDRSDIGENDGAIIQAGS